MWLCTFVCSLFVLKVNSLLTDESKATSFLEDYNNIYSDIYRPYVQASWRYKTDINDTNRDNLVSLRVNIAKWEQQVARNVSMFDYKNFQNRTLSRIFSKISDVGIGAINDEKLVKEFSTLESEMNRIYSTGKVCREGKREGGKEESGKNVTDECFQLSPGLSNILEHSRDLEELKWAWSGWRNATGRKIRPLYPRYIELMNLAARANGFKDAAEQQFANYEWPDFEKDLEVLYEQLKPLYVNLHAYVRQRLLDHYKTAAPDGHIFAHVLGNMWAQEWSSIFDILKPYKDYPDIEIDNAIAQNYTAVKLVEVAEEFYTSLGLPKLPASFWTESMFVKPADREVVCHASAWFMLSNNDVRIKMCIRLNGADFDTIHHELGHVYYYIMYQNLPSYYREGADPAFHEAIGDAITKSVMTPRHLIKLGLLSDYKDSPESDINYLLQSALGSIAFLPFGYILDKWRWGVYRGETPPNQYNKDWWKLRCNYQGVAPPLQRTDADLDPAAKFHVAAGSTYIKYFLSRLIQFSLYKSMCSASNHIGPLHTCDFHGSKEAGNLLKEVLRLGSSRPWPEVMRIISGRDKYDVSAILEYYQPLSTWLEKELKGSSQREWKKECSIFSRSSKHCLGNLPLITTAFLLLFTSFIYHP